jgi:hypothetical protein
LTKRTITHQQAAFLRFELASNDPRRQKTALQDLCGLYRAGRRFAPETGVSFEQIVAGLAINSADAKVVRWSLNAIARLGTVGNTAESAKIALRSHLCDPEIVAAAVSALAALYKGQIPDIDDVRNVDPATRMLAAMQTVKPRLLAKVDLAIDIDTADPEILKLALIVVGLNRDIQHLLHPRHENGTIVRALGQHDDVLVRQYSVWAVLENNRLGLQHLGISLERVADQPSNVQAKMLQLGASAIDDPVERQDLIIAGSNLPRADAREGLAKGLLHTFHEGLQDVTLDWLRTEADRRVQLLLAEHFARYSENVPSYRDEAFAFAERDAEFRERVYLGSEGTSLYGALRARHLRGPGLFDAQTDEQMGTLMGNLRTAAEMKVLVLNATPEDAMLIRPDKEAMELRERLKGVTSPRRQLAFETVYATRLDQIQQEMLRHGPQVLHFSGHGGGGALAFEASNGSTALLPGRLLADILRDYAELQCLVLHACYTDEVAKACLAYVPHVVGSTDSISDLTAPKFTYVFYQALAMGREYANAFAMGRNEVALADEKEAKKYVWA